MIEFCTPFDSLQHSSMLHLLVPMLLVLPTTWGTITFTPTTSPSVTTSSPVDPTTASTVVKLPSFSAVDVCWPFNLVINSCEELDYGVVASAAPDVLQTMVMVVEEDTLILQTNASFLTDHPVKVVVCPWLCYTCSLVTYASARL